MKAKILSILQTLSPTLSVGAISADLLNLGSDIATLQTAGVQLLHFDVMDGHFAPQLTIGPSFVKAIKTSMLKDVHLMIDNPLASIDDYAAAGADIITLHVESDRHIHRALQRIGELTNSNDPERGIARGIAINPSTPVEAIEPFMDMVDIIFVLAVNPGFGGQKFIESTIRRIQAVRTLAQTACNPILIGVDGGITRTTLPLVANLDLDVVVTGSAVFEKRAIAENITALSGILRKDS